MQVEAIRRVDPEAVRLAIDDLESSFPGRYDGPKHRRALDEFVRVRQSLAPALETGKLPESAPPAEALLAGVRAAPAGQSAARLRPVARGAAAVRPRVPGSSPPTTSRTPASSTGLAGTTRSPCSRASAAGPGGKPSTGPKADASCAMSASSSTRSGCSSRALTRSGAGPSTRCPRPVASRAS